MELKPEKEMTRAEFRFEVLNNKIELLDKRIKKIEQAAEDTKNIILKYLRL